MMEKCKSPAEPKHMMIAGGMRTIQYARKELEKLLSDIVGNSDIKTEEEDATYTPSLSHLLSEGGEILTAEANKIYKIIDEIRSNLF